MNLVGLEIWKLGEVRSNENNKGKNFESENPNLRQKHPSLFLHCVELIMKLESEIDALEKVWKKVLFFLKKNTREEI